LLCAEKIPQAASERVLRIMIAAAAIGARHADGGELPGSFDGESAQANRIEQLEDGGVGADAEC
jgi:hypothetical protein